MMKLLNNGKKIQDDNILQYIIKYIFYLSLHISFIFLLFLNNTTRIMLTINRVYVYRIYTARIKK